jgi:hypothetical protein
MSDFEPHRIPFSVVKINLRLGLVKATANVVVGKAKREGRMGWVEFLWLFF